MMERKSFVYGVPVSGYNFTGREEETRRLLADFEGGINVKDLGIHDLRSLIGNVNQEAILFNDSFRNNIRFGKDDATDEQIANAAKIAKAYDFIMETEDGFDTNIGDRGGLAHVLAAGTTIRKYMKRTTSVHLNPLTFGFAY